MPQDALTFAALLTTGPSPGEDPPVGAAAVCQDGRSFATLANPGQLSRAALAVVGLTSDALHRQPKPRQALKRLIEFCGAGPLVVHDAPAFRAFLEAEGVAPPDCLDIIELARIALPQAADHSLEALAALAGVGGEGEEPKDGPVCGAEPAARMLARLWSLLLDELAGLPAVALDHMCRIARTAGSPFAPVLERVGAARGGFDLTSDPDRSLAGLFAEHRELFQQIQKETEPEPTDDPLPGEGICRMLAPGGAVARTLPHFEHRREQIEMVRAVCRAFNAPHHLMVEAGTGTGKSMAYLLPSVAWACTNGDKVLVSTNTRNLQEQLYRKDLPFLEGLLPGRFRAALLKGRRNYLCVRRFVRLVRHFEHELGDPEEDAALLPLLSWAARTESGDLGECNAVRTSAAGLSVASAAVTGMDECAGRACRFRSRCFVRRARSLAQLADIIVVNHALVFAELGLDSRVLPPYRCAIFDEAQNLEDVATEALGVAVENLTFFRETNRLHRARRGAGGSGLLAAVMHDVQEGLGKREGETQERLVGLAGTAMEQVDEVVEAARQFFQVLAEPFAAVPPYEERILLEECSPTLGPGSEAWGAAEALEATVTQLGVRVEDLACELDALTEQLESAAELAGDLRHHVTKLREACGNIRFVLSGSEDGFIYWLERTTRERGTFCSIRAAPLDIGGEMRTFFYNEKRTVILTSATMQVGESFDFMRRRLGADMLSQDELSCVAVGSPFDYDRQALVGVTTFLPDPGGRRDQTYDAELASFLIELLQCTRGRALVLFTSYSLLESVYATLKDELQRKGILVLAQGHGGSREAITSTFRAVTSSVLLGTRSFWEGVDISGEALSCLVMTKLPFHVYTDPLVRGRTEHLRSQGLDPFVNYTLPEAVISFRQGFGRLIRTRRDRGVIVVTDRRLVTKAYGRTFMGSVPGRHQTFSTRDEALEAVGTFFGHGAAES